MYSWGRGEDGQLGLGDAQDLQTPTAVAHLKEINVGQVGIYSFVLKLANTNQRILDRQVACGSGHTVVLTGKSLFVYFLYPPLAFLR